MIVVGGKIIVEGYFPPFDKDFLHRLYSSTKTYVAIAVGMLVTEGITASKEEFPRIESLTA